MAVVDSKQERGKIRQNDSYCMYFAPLDPVYASPNKFWNEQLLHGSAFRLHGTRESVHAFVLIRSIYGLV